MRRTDQYASILDNIDEMTHIGTEEVTHQVYHPAAPFYVPYPKLRILFRHPNALQRDHIVG